MFSVRFKDPDLEDAYRKFALKRSGPTDRFVILSGAGIHLYYAILDWLVIPQMAIYTTLLRVIGAAGIAALWFWTGTEGGRPRLMWASVVIVGIIGGSVGIMIAAIGNISPPYYVGLIHLAVVYSSIVRINFRVCLTLLALTYLMFVLPNPFVPNTTDLISAHFFLIASFMSCGTVNYVVERDRRFEFLTYREREHYYERVRILAEDAARSVERKNALLNVLGHVVKTPLHQIIGYAQIIEQSEPGSGLEDEARSFAAEIYRAGSTLNQQGQRLLDYSRADAGLLPTTLQPTTPARIVREATHRLSSMAEEKKISLEIDCGDEELLVDIRHTTRAVTELIDNAIRYCPPGSKVRIASQLRHDGISILVADNGPGVENFTFDLMGEVLVTADSVRNMGGDKLGIGISLARTLSLLSGGKFYLCSMPDHGTLAQIIFPHAEIAAQGIEHETMRSRAEDLKRASSA